MLEGASRDLIIQGKFACIYANIYTHIYQLLCTHLDYFSGLGFDKIF